MRSPPLVPRRCPQGTSSGISPAFAGLFLTEGQVAHVLLTRSPLYSSPCGDFLARLACVRHAASVRSEPGSNSPSHSLLSCERSRTTPSLADEVGIARVSTHKPVAMIFYCQRTEVAGRDTSRHIKSRTCCLAGQGLPYIFSGSAEFTFYPISRGVSRSFSRFSPDFSPAIPAARP